MVERAGVDIPGVVFLRCVLEGLKLIAAGVGGEVRVPVVCVTERGDAAAFLVDLERNNAIAEAKAVYCFVDSDSAIVRSTGRLARRFFGIDKGESGVTESGDAVRAYEKMEGVCGCFMRENLRRKGTFWTGDVNVVRGPRTLDGDGDDFATWPRLGVEDEDGNSGFGSGVDACGEGVD